MDPETVPATEVERDTTGITDRDVTRCTVLGAVGASLNAVLHTPGDKSVNVEQLWNKVGEVAIRAMCEYRFRHRQRHLLTEKDDPADLTCEMP